MLEKEFLPFLGNIVIIIYMEKNPISNEENTPPEVLHAFYQKRYQANLKNPDLWKRQRKFPNGKIYIKHEIIETSDRIGMVGSPLGEDCGEIIKYDSGVYLIKIGPDKYAALTEEKLDSFN